MYQKNWSLNATKKNITKEHGSTNLMSDLFRIRPSLQAKKKYINKSNHAMYFLFIFRPFICIFKKKVLLCNIPRVVVVLPTENKCIKDQYYSFN